MEQHPFGGFLPVGLRPQDALQEIIAGKIEPRVDGPDREVNGEMTRAMDPRRPLVGVLARARKPGKSRDEEEGDMEETFGGQGTNLGKKRLAVGLLLLAKSQTPTTKSRFPPLYKLSGRKSTGGELTVERILCTLSALCESEGSMTIRLLPIH